MNKQNSVGSAEPALSRILKSLDELRESYNDLSGSLQRQQDDDESAHYLLLRIEGIIKSRNCVNKEG